MPLFGAGTEGELEGAAGETEGVADLVVDGEGDGSADSVAEGEALAVVAEVAGAPGFGLICR